MDIVFFIIFISLLIVTILILLAFFPIKVSWFYFKGKNNTNAPLRGTAERQRNNPARTPNYPALGDDAFDDPEL